MTTATLSPDALQGLRDAAPAIAAKWQAASPRSAALFARAQGVFPGGYTRDAVMRAPYPAFLTEGRGAVVTDADGRAINDFWFNATSLPLGHADPRVVEAITAQTRIGTAWYGPSEVEIALAETLVARLDGAEKLRFANSGSEAVMLALRLARAGTGRDLIVKFNGSYHGAYDDMQFAITPSPEVPGDAFAPVASSGGLVGASGRVVALPWNDAEALRDFMAAHGDKVAGIIVEPMANKMGALLPETAFLAAARTACDETGAALIFDEVISFRTAFGGAQSLVGVRPDMTTLGKIIGGGLPIGAVAGSARWLDLTDQRKGRVTHAGTFNANPVTARAGLATLRALTPAVFDELAHRGAALRGRLSTALADMPVQVTGTGSLFKITATTRPLRNWDDTGRSDTAWETTLSLALLEKGFLLTPQLQGCLSTATTDAQCDALVDAIKTIITETTT